MTYNFRLRLWGPILVLWGQWKSFDLQLTIPFTESPYECFVFSGSVIMLQRAFNLPVPLDVSIPWDKIFISKYYILMFIGKNSILIDCKVVNFHQVFKLSYYSHRVLQHRNRPFGPTDLCSPRCQSMLISHTHTHLTQIPLNLSYPCTGPNIF